MSSVLAEKVGMKVYPLANYTQIVIWEIIHL